MNGLGAGGGYFTITMNNGALMKLMKRIGAGLLALCIATLIWIPCVHFFFVKDVTNFHKRNGLSPKAEQLAARQMQLWTEPKMRERELAKMRTSNAEWDFMGRTFLVWSLAEMALRNPATRQEYLPVMDQIIGETLRLEKEHGIYFFLMPYARATPYLMQPPRSLFLDGEIGMMLAARRMVEEKPEYKPLLHERVEVMLDRMKRSGLVYVESYPDECWTFDHVAALAAVRMEDHLDGGDHSEFIHQWVKTAKEKLTDARTGILISSYTTTGQAQDGPEGSSIWMISHCLRLLDEDFARDQYQRARKELHRGMAGFAWAREWPDSWRGQEDVDSGPVIPVLDISAGSSGMAFIGASSFGDDEYLSALAATLDFSAFPTRRQGRLKYCASNQVGDAALLYASVLGPLWEKVEGGAAMNHVFYEPARVPRSGAFFSPKYFLVRAAMIGLLFMLAHFAGLREYTTFVTGTTGSPDVSFRLSAFYGMIYLALYMGCVVVAPIFVLTAALLGIWNRATEKIRLNKIVESHKS
jgi:Linalool dehydratase/isomerase